MYILRKRKRSRMIFQSWLTTGAERNFLITTRAGNWNLLTSSRFISRPPARAFASQVRYSYHGIYSGQLSPPDVVPDTKQVRRAPPRIRLRRCDSQAQRYSAPVNQAERSRDSVPLITRDWRRDRSRLSVFPAVRDSIEFYLARSHLLPRARLP